MTTPLAGTTRAAPLTQRRQRHTSLCILFDRPWQPCKKSRRTGVTDKRYVLRFETVSPRNTYVNVCNHLAPVTSCVVAVLLFQRSSSSWIRRHYGTNRAAACSGFATPFIPLTCARDVSGGRFYASLIGEVTKAPVFTSRVNSAGVTSAHASLQHGRDLCRQHVLEQRPRAGSSGAVSAVGGSVADQHVQPLQECHLQRGGRP